jgi:fucose permease
MLSAIFVLPESLQPGTKSSAHHWLDLRSLKYALSLPSIGLLLLTIFVTTFAFAQFETTLALFTKTFDLGTRSMFFVFAYVGVILTISQGLLVRRLLPKLGEFKMSLAGAALMIVGLFLIGMSGQNHSLPLLYSVMPIAVVGFSALTPSLQSLLSLRTRDTQQGEILGVGQSMSSLARILGPVVAMLLFDDEHVATPYWVATGLMAVGLIMIWRIGDSANTQKEAEDSTVTESSSSESI